MRKFKLINSAGAEYDLNGLDHFFQSPAGLGITRKYSATNIGDYYIQTDNIMSQKKVSGEIVFKDYQYYSDFVSFIGDGNLTLCYCPIAPTWYYLDCAISKLNKTELEVGRLFCSIDFTGFGPWYGSTKLRKTNTTDTAGKTYPYTYSYTYVDASRGTIRYTNTGRVPAPCKIKIYGPCENPHWVLSQGGQDISTGDITLELLQGETLVIDSNTPTMEIAKYTDNGIIDVYQYSDFDTERFIYLPPGDSTLLFTHDGQEALNVIVEVRQLADTI